MNLKILICFLIFTCQIISCTAQRGNYSTNSKKAISHFEDALSAYQKRNPENAKTALLKALKADANFYEANVFLAEILIDLKEYDEAIAHMKKAITIDAEKQPRVYYRLANVLVMTSKFNEAIPLYEKFLSYIDQPPELLKEAEYKLASAEFSAEAIKNPVKFNPINMGENINSEFDEYYPALTVDNSQLYFTRMRKADEFSKTMSKFEEDFYISYKENGIWSKARPLGPPLNTHYNEGVQSISPDGRTIIFTACNKDDSFGSCDLYISEKIGGKWQKPQNIGSNINSKAWESQPTVSSDGSLLIFTRRNQGKEEKYNLWYSKKDENGEWHLAKKMNSIINTDGDENSPYLHPSGKVLYFSSNRHPGMGGFDLFKSDLQDDGTWGKPINLGYPINTIEDQRHIIINAEGKLGYISTKYDETFGGIDIYQFEIPEFIQPPAVTYIKGITKTYKGDKTICVFYELVDLSSGEVVTSGSSDKISGEYIACLPAKGKFAFNAQAEGYLFHSENFTLNELLPPGKFFNLDISLKPIEIGESVVLNNIFFETASSQLLPESKSELNKLIQLLSQNNTLRIEIGGHTDNVGSDENNKKLSLERAQSVVNYLVTKGIDRKMLTSNGYGSKSPVADNNTEEGRAKNRRTEFKITAN